jgi:hypothetical protein
MGEQPFGAQAPCRPDFEPLLELNISKISLK